MDNIETKQGLLRREVLEGGLNAEQFIEYLGRVKNQGQNVDLEHWTLEQLENAIQAFKAKREKNKVDLMSSRMSLGILKKSKIFEQVKKQKVFYENSQLWDYEVYDLQDCTKSDACLKIPENDLPRVSVEKHEIKQVGGFIFGIGSRNELHLTISTNFTDNRVCRKSEDVDWLRTILAVDHPGYFLPSLEPDRELNQDDKKGIASRISQIEGFLNKVMKCTPFHYSKHVRVFFQEQNPKRFAQFRNRQALLEIIRDPDALESATGTLMVQISDKLNKTIKSSSSLANEFNSLYNDLLNCSYKILGSMDKLKKHVAFLYNITNKLGQKYSEAQQLFKLEENKLPTIFLSFGNITSNLYKNLDRHSKAFNDLTEAFTRDVSRDWSEFITQDAKIQKEHKRYLYEKDALLRKKERYASDITKWQLPEADFLALRGRDINQMPKQQRFEKMFPNDTEIESRCRIWLACVNHNYIESYKAFLKEQERFLLQKYLPYSGEATCTCKDMLNNLSQFNQMIFG